jgi:UDP-N-acetylmuramate dehydrogenase
MTPAERHALEQLAGDLGATVRFDQPLAELTTWRIGGPADVVLAPRTRAALLAAVAWCRGAGVPCRALGNGSNLLAPDEGVRGVVLHLANNLAAARFGEDGELWAEAGCFLPKLARDAATLGRGGLECVVGVPGTVGGACVTNAGIPSGTIGDVLVDVDVLTADGQVRTLARGDLALGHRTSRLREEDWIVLGARLALPADDPEAIKGRLAEHLEYRRRTQPLNQATCGSVFRHIKGTEPFFAAKKGSVPFIGALLEAAGCKGLRRGAAEVSALHANWIVNLGGASAADVRALMADMQARVRAHCGAELTAEVVVWEP